uniref:(northern house mosquito) hypothetical protein n=1 Tax=Culex pipiens TaxID=7175 RepID=A0A8D8FSJ4_CULPI
MFEGRRIPQRKFVPSSRNRSKHRPRKQTKHCVNSTIKQVTILANKQLEERSSKSTVVELEGHRVHPPVNNKETLAASAQKIQIEMRIPDREMARSVMLRTIQLLQDTAKTTKSLLEKEQALECIELIKRDNPTLQ